MSECIKCGEAIHPLDVANCRVNAEEARDFRAQGLKLNDLVCAPCFHMIKWPKMAPMRSDDDINPMLQSTDP